MFIFKDEFLEHDKNEKIITKDALEHEIPDQEILDQEILEQFIQDPELLQSGIFTHGFSPDKTDMRMINELSKNDVTTIGTDEFLDNWLQQFVNGVVPGLLDD